MSGQPRGRTSKKGLLLINLGTPDAPEPDSVARYLKEFLMDKRVMDIPWIFRWLLVNWIIIPKRKFLSSEAYKTVWTERGSPLLYHLEDLSRAVEASLGEEFHVEIAMRYGNPSILDALKAFKEEDVSDIVVFPLYPQYAESTTRSSEEECLRQAERIGLRANIRFVPPFFDNESFIGSYVEQIERVWSQAKPDHLLLTFHGLPERHLRSTDPTGGTYCLKAKNCCDVVSEVNKRCYRAQCYATARAIAEKMGLKERQYSVSFQSRLGKSALIQPYTENRLRELPSSGIKKMAVVCPSFVSDCLETLEEIGERGKHEFLSKGGESYFVIPCLNSTERWVETVKHLALDCFFERAPYSESN